MIAQYTVHIITLTDHIKNLLGSMLGSCLIMSPNHSDNIVHCLVSIARYPLHMGGVAGQRCQAPNSNPQPLNLGVRHAVHYTTETNKLLHMVYSHFQKAFSRLFPHFFKTFSPIFKRFNIIINIKKMCQLG